ncbi:hypothetical protein PR048_006183 [Dryococelus australis]|uniref:Uncharacterized protein n=1 Tax=Dryococelus australis TaxID=614101 RepID=A0ABQ9IA85_9NEOP|nr:hypothetical protein PR048_006183 [Dryococelus australis]
MEAYLLLKSKSLTSLFDSDEAVTDDEVVEEWSEPHNNDDDALPAESLFWLNASDVSHTVLISLPAIHSLTGCETTSKVSTKMVALKIAEAYATDLLFDFRKEPLKNFWFTHFLQNYVQWINFISINTITKKYGTFKTWHLLLDLSVLT